MIIIMKLGFAIASLFTLIAGGGVYLYTQGEQLFGKKISYVGVLDAADSLKDQEGIGYTHEFTVWKKQLTNELDLAFTNAKNHKRDLLLTVEPWPEDGVSGEIEYAQIQRGEYDQTIKTICSKLGTEFKKPILRWGHEVDLAGNSRYAWATKDTEGFKKAFQKLYTTCKSAAKNVSVMWSPAGVEAAPNYYPGGEYVDLIGLSIFGYPDYENKEFGKPASLDDVLSPRYARLASLNKPIILAELGVSGTPEYQKAWLDRAFSQFTSKVVYPNLAGFIYFNAQGGDAWVANINPPNFRMNDTDLITLYKKYGFLQ
jgi:endoglucanase